jgi:hypothetical protein
MRFPYILFTIVIIYAQTSATAPGCECNMIRMPFCGEPRLAKRATAFEIAYKGNTGSFNRWGCNIMEIPCTESSFYDYVTVFECNPGGTHQSYSCSAFNKIGPDGGIDPGWHSALDFQVMKGQKRCIAFDENSRGAVSCSSGLSGPEMTPLKQRAGTWYEFDFGNEMNDGQSGSDVSKLVADKYGLGFVGMAIEVPGKGVCSWLKETGESFQSYVGGMEDIDGVGCNGYSKAQVKVTLGY